MEDQLSTGVRESIQIVVVRGDLDEVLAAELEDVIEGCRDGRPLIIDLSAVEFMSSAGLDVLLRNRPGRTALVCPPGSVARLFEVVRTNRRVPIFKDLDSTIESVRLSRSVEPQAPRLLPERHSRLVHARIATHPRHLSERPGS
jgi:anti-anti-sigma factor